MNDPDTPPATPRETPLSREERLAAKLRENLRRRKAQARALTTPEDTKAANQGK